MNIFRFQNTKSMTSTGQCMYKGANCTIGLVPCIFFLFVKWLKWLLFEDWIEVPLICLLCGTVAGRSIQTLSLLLNVGTVENTPLPLIESPWERHYRKTQAAHGIRLEKSLSCFSDSQSALVPYVLHCPRESLCPLGSFFLYITILSHIDDLK